VSGIRTALASGAHRACLRVAAGLLVAAGGLGCGGGSPSDVLLPSLVEVTFDGPRAPEARSIVLELASASGRDVAVNVVAVGLEEVTGVAFELDYDPALLEFVGSAPGVFFGPTAVARAAVVEAAPGRLVGVSASPEQTQTRSGSGTVLTLAFQLRQLRDAESVLAFRSPESQIYGTGGSLEARAFTGGRLVTRIQASP
jgi:hypothetical protein